MKEHRPLKMKNVLIELPRSSTGAEILAKLKEIGGHWIMTAQDAGMHFIRTEFQNNKLRCFMDKERVEFSVRLV